MKGNIMDIHEVHALRIEIWTALNRAGLTFSPEEYPQKMREVPVERVVEIVTDTLERINA
jgi:hypothetical protein